MESIAEAVGGEREVKLAHNLQLPACCCSLCALSVIGAMQVELTTEKSTRMVAEQLLSIVQQDLAEQQLRVSAETTMRVKLENELVFVKVRICTVASAAPNSV